MKKKELAIFAALLLVLFVVIFLVQHKKISNEQKTTGTENAEGLSSSDQDLTQKAGEDSQRLPLSNEHLNDNKPGAEPPPYTPPPEEEDKAKR